MGMFDYLRCDLPLSDGDNAHVFQTKSLDCTMSDCLITTPEGHLTVDGVLTACDGDIEFHHYDAGKIWNYRATFRRGDCIEVCRLDQQTEQWHQVWNRCMGYRIESVNRTTTP